jgi:hypothetical protein
MTDEKLADVHGKWTVLLKITAILIPAATAMVCVVLIPWAIWVTNSIFKMERDHVAYQAIVEDIREMKGIVAALPPDDWRRRIQLLEDLARTNVADHTDIKIDLVKIKTALKIEDP